LFKSTQGILWPAVSFGILFAIWELGVRIFKIPQYLLPLPGQIFLAVVEHFDSLISESLWTTIEVIGGYALAASVAIPLALLIVLSPTVERLIYPPMVATQSVPKIALAPLFVVWFGFGMAPKIAVAFLISFFPIVVDAIVGLRSIDPEMVRLARSMGATPMRIFVKVQLPNALPSIFAGLKVASTLAVVGALTGEFIGADRGLGYVLVQAIGQLDTPLLFATLLVLSLLAMVFYYLVEGVERLLIPWHVSHRSHG
jgi:NitT/TauT family transport system permease protein